MKTRGVWWTTLTRGWLAAAAIGCGSDAQGSDEGASEMAAPSTPSGNSAAAGRGSPTRENVTATECVVQTLGVFSQRPDGYSDDCVTCLCEQNAKTVALCDDQANNCWGLISCAGANCSGTEGIDEANCAIENCGQFIEGSGLAMSVGVLLRGNACSAKCPPKK
jgi:hypothetical protein